MQDPILVPVDFSDSATEVLMFAGEMARCRSRPLVVLHVVNGSLAEEGGANGSNALHPSLSIADRARERLQELMAELSEQNPEMDALRSVRTVLVNGVPASRILEVAEREGAGMIVMGSHGRRGLSRLMMGSVAESVARESRVPVTIVKDGSGGQEEAVAQ